MIVALLALAVIVAYLFAILGVCHLLGRRSDQLVAFMGKEWGE